MSEWQDQQRGTGMAKLAIMPASIREVAERYNMSPAIISGGHVFFTGVTGADGDARMPADCQAQFTAIFAKIGTVLAEVGLSFGAIVEMTTYHVGLRDHFEAFDAVRLAHFSAPYPAWTAVEVAGLRREGAVVEVRVIASIDVEAS
jgi:enamine deaminase RidA (YjgF/YER057c/UK114 family)